MATEFSFTIRLPLNCWLKGVDFGAAVPELNSLERNRHLRKKNVTAATNTHVRTDAGSLCSIKGKYVIIAVKKSFLKFQVCSQ
jgi:hypothetical protein